MPSFRLFSKIGPPTIFAAAHPIISDKINKNGNTLLRAIFSPYYLQMDNPFNIIVFIGAERQNRTADTEIAF
jgi:hypothetical protein